MTRPLRVFLCHSSNDKLAVRELYQKLRAETWIQPWLDEEELYPGQDWNMEIEKAVETADAIIVCLSKGSITKEGYIQRELRIVLDFADYKPEGTLYIIPVRLEECEPPRRLRAWQYADYFEGQRDRAFQRLLVSLKRRADGLGLATEELKDKKIAREKLELDAREKAELIRRERIQKKKESHIQQDAKAYDRKEKSEKLIDQTINLFLVNSRWLGIGGIILLFLILGGFGLNYLIKNFPVATAAVSPTNNIPTFELAASTNVFFTPIPQATETSIPTQTLGIGSTMTSEKDGMVMLYVPAGEFTMGSDDSDQFDERPEHQVNLDAFWIDQTEVTNKQYKACVDAGVCEPPSEVSSATHPSYYGNSEFGDYPVIWVNWDKANRYCEVWTGIGGELPTEAQWEKAARGTNGNIYPWGNKFDGTIVNFCDINCSFQYAIKSFNDGYADISPVGSYPFGQSVYGAFDMAGNAWEWVSDWYDVYPGGDANTASTFGQKLRVLRGGAWYSIDGNVRSANRFGHEPTDSFDGSGFRCTHLP